MLRNTRDARLEDRCIVPQRPYSRTNGLNVLEQKCGIGHSHSRLVELPHFLSVTGLKGDVDSARGRLCAGLLRVASDLPDANVAAV